MPRLAGKVCVINGAASEIGRAVAGRFAAEGAGPAGGLRTQPGCAGQAPLDGGITEAFTVPD
jgi:NAD(P)-dependent dehydrogenase (short-subunit alcohol dehydrogenase family)